MNRFKLLFLLLPLLGFAEAPRYSKEPIIEQICGMVLIPHQDYVDYVDTRGVCGLESYDVFIPGGSIV